MLETITHTALAAEARTRVIAALNGSVDVADSWLAGLPGVALIEESARSPDDDQARRLARALSGFGERELLAVASEELRGTDDVFRLGATAQDLNDFAYARSGLNYALLPLSGLSWLVLCTVHDYLLVAGPATLVNEYAHDPALIASEFRAFISENPEWSRPENQALLRHLDWIEA